MAILQATGEDIGFTGFPQIPQISTSTGRFRAGYGRCAVGANSGNSTADPPANRIQLPTFTSSSVVWFHCVFFDTDTGSVLNCQNVLFRSPDGVSRIVIRTSASLYGTPKVSSRNAAGTLTDLATFSSSHTSSTLYSLDVKIDYSVSGGIQVWLNGTMVVNFAGDPRTDSATQLNQVELSNWGTNGQTLYSEIIVADQDTRGMALWTLPATASGNTQSWLPNTVGNINEINNSDGTFVSTTVNNDLSQWSPSGAVAPAGTWNVLGFFQEARAQVGATGPQHMDWSLRTSGTDYLAGLSIALSTSFNNYSRQWALNPNTSAPWLIADFTAAGFNYGVKALA